MVIKDYSAKSRFLHAEADVFRHFVYPDLFIIASDFGLVCSFAENDNGDRMQPPYLVFLGDANNPGDTKTGAGIAYWCRDICVGQNRMPECTIDLGLNDMSVDEAVTAGARTLVVGVAPDGGRLGPAWLPTMLEALEKGLDVAAGLHERLSDVPTLERMAKANSRTLYDVRQPTQSFPVGNGRKRSGLRLLTVGTDCAVGKMYASLALEREMRRRGMKADFRATGQTGIFIAGQGVSVDAVIADFISGASEFLSPANDPDHWDVIEGQGSLFHPSYAGVTLGLVHGSQPDFMVLCHEAGRSHILNIEDYPIPDLEACMELYTSVARLTNPAATFVGMCTNTANLDDAQASRYLRETEKLLGIPCCDPMRDGVACIVDALPS